MRYCLARTISMKFSILFIIVSISFLLMVNTLHAKTVTERGRDKNKLLVFFESELLEK